MGVYDSSSRKRMAGNLKYVRLEPKGTKVIEVVKVDEKKSESTVYRNLCIFLLCVCSLLTYLLIVSDDSYFCSSQDAVFNKRKSSRAVPKETKYNKVSVLESFQPSKNTVVCNLH